MPRRKYYLEYNYNLSQKSCNNWQQNLNYMKFDLMKLHCMELARTKLNFKGTLHLGNPYIF
jgi:hypothetical protein